MLNNYFFDNKKSTSKSKKSQNNYLLKNKNIQELVSKSYLTLEEVYELTPSQYLNLRMDVLCKKILSGEVTVDEIKNLTSSERNSRLEQADEQVFHSNSETAPVAP